MRVQKALENVSGVYQQSTGIGDVAFFSLRGFGSYDGSNSFVYRDGVRGDFAAGQSFPDLANIERIEVLKGPASILYGRIEPGGLINLVTKKPLATPYYALEQQFGSHSFYRTTLDASGPLTKDDTLLYRLNLTYENAHSFQEFVGNDRVFVAPIFRWNITETTQADFWLEYLSSHDGGLNIVPSVGNRPASISRTRNLGEPDNGQINTTDYRFGFNWSHTFGQHWTLRHVFDGRINQVFQEPFVGINGVADPENCTRAGCEVSRGLNGHFGAPQRTGQYFTSLDLTGRFVTWGLAHTLLVGGDWWRSTCCGDPHETGAFVFLDAPSIDLFRPIHTGIDRAAFKAEGQAQALPGTENPAVWYGFYFQDQIKLPYHFQVLGGFRYDRATAHDEASNTDTNDDDRISPRVALLWQPLSQLTFYGNYVENFGAAAGRTKQQGFLPPQTAQQWELGIKTELLDGRLMGTLAWYNLTKQNVVVPDPDPILAQQGFVTSIGEIRNRGLELDVVGEIVPGWQIIGGYSYINSKITKGGPEGTDANGGAFIRGKRLFGVPKHGGSLWSTYSFQHGPLRGLKLGAGILLRSRQEANNENTVHLPGYTLVNLMASYQWTVGSSTLTAQLNVDNVLDKKYFFAGGFGGGAFAGTPRMALGSVRWEW